jgi:release factor glutamine methyltransferase
VTVLDVIQKSAEFLAGKGIDSPRLNAELLLAHVLRLPRMKLYLNFDRTLSPEELDTMRELVRRRARHEPLQYILGSASFCGLELTVNPHVLVPRPETELLAEAGWQFLRTRPGAPTALDFGTGSGCLAIALAAHCPTARVTALDVSEPALALARANAERHSVAARIEFVAGNDLAALPAGARFDLIISNPPYIPTAAIESLPPEVRDFEPRVALDGGPDGLRIHRQLAAGAGAFLKPGARLMVELADGQADAARELYTGHKWIVDAIQPDYTRCPRILIARAATGECPPGCATDKIGSA